MTNALTTLSQIDLEYREAKATADFRAAELVRREIEGIYIRRLQAVAAAFDDGFSKRKIAMIGLHTKDTNTAYKLLEESKPYVNAAGSEGAGAAAEFQRGDTATSVIITPSAGDLAQVLGALGLPASHLDENPSSGEATFDYDVTMDRLKSVTPAFTPGVGRHPVVALVMAPGSEFGKRALEWARSASAAA